MSKLYVICGHGAGDPGAVSGGKSEATLVRRLGAELVKLGGPSVVLLDTKRNWYADGGVNSALKKKVGSNPVIELHMDSSDSSSAKGGHVIIHTALKADAQDKALASAIKKMFPGRDDIIVNRGNLANINRAKSLGINYRLLECCFISNKSDREKFVSKIDELAKIILQSFGIIEEEGDWFDMATKAELKAVVDAALKGVTADVAALKKEVAAVKKMVTADNAQLTDTKDVSGRGIKMPPLEQLRFMAGKQQEMYDTLDKLEEQIENIESAVDTKKKK